MNKNFVVGLVVALMLFVSTGSAFSAETLADVSTKANNANVKAEATKGGLVAEIANRVDGDVNLQSQINNIQLTPGPQGEQGVQGIQGDKGERGIPGVAGAKGVDGEPGPQGIQGEPGVAGPPGVQGATGPVGATGATGPQGISGLKGDTGATGATGVTGEPGVQGLTGATGPQGLKGDVGETGPQGLKGDKGDRGIQGLTGPEGQQGFQGDPGPAGPTGATGATGATGPQGLDGADGGSGVRNANYLFARSYVQMKVYNALDILEVFSKGVQIDKQSDDSVLKVTLSERFRSQYVPGLMYYIFVDGVFAGHLGNIYDSLAYGTSASVHINFTAISPQGYSRIYAGVHFVEIRVKPVAVNSVDHAWIAFDSSYLEVEEIIDASLM